MFTKIINFLLIYEISTMRSIKRKREDTEESITRKRLTSTFESEFNDELIEAYGRFFVPNKNTFPRFQKESEEPTSTLPSEKDVLTEELIQKYEEFYPELLDYEEVGDLMVDEFGNLVEVVEVPLENQNSGLSLYEDISSDSNASENEGNSFQQVALAKRDRQETTSIYYESNKLPDIGNNDVARFLLPFTLSESFGKSILEERNNNFLEQMSTTQEINVNETNSLTADDLTIPRADLILSDLSKDQSSSKKVEEELQEFNNILEMAKPSSFTNISSKHLIHEKIDAEIIEEILDINGTQNPVEYDSKHHKLVEHNANEILDYREQNPSQILNIAHNIDTSPPEYNEIYEGSLDVSEDRPFTSMPVLNISSTIMTPPSEHSTIVEMPGDMPSLQQNYRELVFSETSPHLPEASLQPISQDDIEKNYLKIVQNITANTKAGTFAEWQIARLDEIKLLIFFVRFSKSKYANIIKSFFEFLDNQIMFILDKLKLRNSNQLENFDLNKYSLFMFKMTETINELGLFLFLMQYKNNFEENILHILCFEFVQLFDFFPKFPELMTLGSLLNQGADEKLILYLRIIHLIINENMNRLEEIKPVVLFIIKKLFMAPDRKGRELNIKAFEKFTLSEFYIVTSVCKKDHSNLYFFLWEFPPKKLKAMKYEAKVEGGYIYDLTSQNVEFFRVVLHTFIFQHIMFTEYHNIGYEPYEKLLDESLKSENCIFCLFGEYLGLISADTQKKNLTE